MVNPIKQQIAAVNNTQNPYQAIGILVNTKILHTKCILGADITFFTGTMLYF